ncbi:unnamed protein product [Trichobilharzia regenti]|nr:unnamed protein product [Trichobilharzia regenti]
MCSDSIEPVVEVANMRRQIVVSPTVESVRFARRRQYPYFFRTVPSMTHVRTENCMITDLEDYTE